MLGPAHQHQCTPPIHTCPDPLAHLLTRVAWLSEKTVYFQASALGLVLGLLALVVVLAGMGGGGFVAWRRFPEIRAWWENRRNTAEGVWAEEDEFSISIDAFTSSEDTIGGEDDA